MANVTYKHLEGRTLLGPLSLSQWTQLLAGVVAGLTFGMYLSPLPATATVFASCLLPGLPLAASYGAMGLEFSLGQLTRVALRHWRDPRQHLPGPGRSTTGYVVVPALGALDEPSRNSAVGVLAASELGELWDA